jgi:hypothetical protein
VASICFLLAMQAGILPFGGCMNGSSRRQ